MKELKGHTYEANIGYHSEPQEGECSQVIPKATGQSKTCKCGSTSHKRTTHKDCPLKAKSVSADSVEHSEVESDYADLPSENSLLDSSEDERFFSDEESVDAKTNLCDCGRAHKRDCPHNPRNLKGKKMQAASSYCSKGKAPSKGKSVASKKCSFSPFSDHSPKRRKRAKPLQSRKGLTSRLFTSSSSSPSRHKSSPLVTKSPHARTRRGASRRLCLDVSGADDDHDCYITNFEPTKEIIINPPDEEWKAKAIKCIEEWWSESTICTTVEHSDIVERGGNIAPHKIERIVGDGHCLFRAISKAITGNQENHQLFRAAVVQWMLSERHPPQLAKYVGSVGENSVCSEVVREYIERSKMSHDTWGSDKEIRAFATMFQIVIYVSNNSPGGRRWNAFPPLFADEATCMKESDYKLYLYHSDGGIHYDLVIPKSD